MARDFRVNDPVSGYDNGSTAMEFRLTYAGPLLSTQRDPIGEQRNERAEHKHELRRVFHRQLARLWEINQQLKEAKAIWYEKGHPSADAGGRSWCTSDTIFLKDYLANRNNKFNFKFVPLVRREYASRCNIKILFLRPDNPGGPIISADIDNRLKTLFDSLRMPQSASEIKENMPRPGEDPFYCLLEDDSLISSVSIDTDILLEPIDGHFDQSEARIIIKVKILPYHTNPANVIFA